MVDTTLTPSSLAKTVTGDLVLRVCGSTRHGQIVRLRSAKCSVGSGPQCTLRLRARGVGPVHCLILRGVAGTVVRRWSADTRLNGRAFGDAPLVPGDRLTIGSIELEVLQCQPPTGRALADARQTDFGHLVSSLPADVRSSSSSPTEPQDRDEPSTRLRLANRQGRQRARRLVRQLRAAKQQLAGLKQQWQSERDELQKQLNQRTEGLDAQCTDLEGQREQLQQERQQWQAERSEAQRQIAQRTEELATLRKELAAERDAMQRRRQQLDGEHAAIGPEQTDPAADSTPQPEPSLGPERPPEPPPVKTGKEPPPVKTGKEAPVELADVFRRMGTVGVFEEDQHQRTEAPAQPREEPQPRPPGGGFPEQASPAPQPAEDDEGESIDAYMSRLMERARAGKGESPQPPQFEPSEQQSQQTAEPPPPPPPPKRRGRAEMLPRAVAPERDLDLSAMREVANLSAHSAIGLHTLRQMVRAKRAKLLVALAGVIAAAVLLWIWWTKGTGDLTFYGVLTIAVVALYWGLQYIVLTARAAAGKTPGGGGKSQKNPQNDEK